MRRMLNKLHEVMYRAAQECVPFPSYPGMELTEELTRRDLLLRGEIDTRLIKAAHILEKIFGETKLAWDNTAWLITEKYRDIWSLLEGACLLVEEQAGLRGPGIDQRLYNRAVAHRAETESPSENLPRSSSADHESVSVARRNFAGTAKTTPK